VSRHKQEATEKMNDAERRATAAGVMSSGFNGSLTLTCFSDGTTSGGNGGQSGQKALQDASTEDIQEKPIDLAVLEDAAEV
jgi:hypothetical protein